MKVEKQINVFLTLSIIFLAYALSSFISSLFLFKIKPCVNLSGLQLKSPSFKIPVFVPLEKEGFFKSPQAHHPINAQPIKETITFNLNNYVLKGTIICSQCRHSIALLKDMQTGKTQPVTVGEEINGFKVKKITPNCVIFSKNGEEVQLRLFKTRNFPGNSINPLSSISSLSQHTYSVKKSEIIREISSGKFLRYINILPVDNPVSGLKVLYVNRQSFIYKLGIRPGDIITSINNITIKTPEDSFSAFEQLKSSDSVTITVFRNGKQTILHYELE